MESVDIIYDLIQNDNSINTLNDNLELFQEFFYHDMSIRYNGLKVIEIYKYLLSLNLVDDNELFPYINSKIMHDFNSYIMQITQAVYTQNYYVKDECVDIIYNMIDTYNIFKEYNAKTELYQLEDEKQFIRDYTGAMIVLLNSSFFDISTDNIFKMINSIKNNEYLISIIESGKMGDNLLDQDYIFEYLSRFLFTTEFINEENIENDIFINSIKEGKIKDINTLKKMFNNLDINYLLMVLKNNLSLLVDILDNTNDDITIKQELFNIIKAKIEENDYIILLDFIMKDERYNLYITDDEKYKIINHLVMSEPTDLTDKQIFYLIKNGDRSLLSAFLINLKEILNNNNWRDSTRDIIEKATKSIITYEYDFESAIKDLDKFFKGEDSDMNYLRMYSIIRCLIKNILNDDTISVFFIHSNNCDGYAMNGKNVIGIEQRQIFDLCKQRM